MAPDHLDCLSRSLSVTYERELKEAADSVIPKINENLPRASSDTIMYADSVHC